MSILGFFNLRLCGQEKFIVQLLVTVELLSSNKFALQGFAVAGLTARFILMYSAS